MSLSTGWAGRQAAVQLRACRHSRCRAFLQASVSGAGAAKDPAVAAADAASAEAASPLVIEHAADAATAQLEVNGQQMNAVILDPLTPQDAEAAARRQLLALR